MEYKTLTIFYALLIIAGFIFSYIYGKSTKRFVWREYIALSAGPFIAVISISVLMGLTPLYIFLISCVLLPGFEWILGFVCHKVLGAPLWQYKRYPLPGAYTSYLTLPFWGAGIVLLWLILKSF